MMIEQNTNLEITNIYQNIINVNSFEKLCFGWRNVGAMPQICINFLTLAQRWTNGDIQTMFIEQNNILEITNINQNM